MADKKISELSSASNLFDSTLMIVQDSENKQASYDLFKSAPIVDIAIVGGSITTPVDGSIYRVVLDSDLNTSWIADAADQDNSYFCTVVFIPPAEGVKRIVSVPVLWDRLGGLSTIELSPGDKPIFVSLVSGLGSVNIVYTAIQVEV